MSKLASLLLCLGTVLPFAVPVLAATNYEHSANKVSIHDSGGFLAQHRRGRCYLTQRQVCRRHGCRWVSHWVCRDGYRDGGRDGYRGGGRDGYRGGGRDGYRDGGRDGYHDGRR